MPSRDPYLAHILRKLKPSSPLEDVLGDDDDDTVSIPVIIRVSNPNWDPSRYEGLTVTSRMGSILAGRASTGCLEDLEDDPDVVSIQASRPGGEPESYDVLGYVNAVAVLSASTPERGAGAIVGIIDTGIDVLHQAFQRNGKTRILEIWDQTDPGFGSAGNQMYGRVYREDDINEFIRNPDTLPSELGRDPLGHGTHVASIAAGSPFGTFPGGVAPEARIVFVKPNLEVSMRQFGGVGYSQSHLDALSYLDKVAGKEPLVVNVSLGQNAGAHDGTSPFEAAFDEFTFSGLRQGRVVVKSAGNERNHDTHAALMLPPGSAETLMWKSLGGARMEDVVELWFKGCDELRFRLVDPSGESTDVVDWATPMRSSSFASGNGYSLEYTRYRQDNGDSSLVVTITRGDGDTPPVISNGTWKLEIESGAIRAEGEIHAWIERLSLTKRPLAFLNHISQEMTVSIPGTARSVISVGAVGTSASVCLDYRSSYGPTRDGRRKPDLCAPGVDILGAKSGTLDEVVAKTGTSMAAPHVAGAVALLLSKRKNAGQRSLGASQVSAAISQQTKNFTGRWNPGQGYGLLDVKALLEAF